MTHSRIVAFLNSLEQGHDVQRMMLNGVCVWPLLRNTIGGHLLTPMLTPSDGLLRKNASWPARVAVLAKGLLRSARLPHEIAKADLMFNVYNGQHCRVGQHTEDRFSQPLIEAADSLGLSTTVVEHLLGGTTAFPSFRSKHRYDASALLEGAAMLHWRKRIAPLDEIEGLSRLLQEVKTASPAFDPERLRDQLHNFTFYLQFHSRVLEAVRPRTVFMVSWYNVEHMALAHACNSMGIVSVDLQHGVQGPAHLAYGPWRNMPKHGWSMMPRRFWCWDEASAAGIAQWAEGTGMHPMVLGNPWLERSATMPAAVHWEPDGHKHILYTAQPLVDLLPEALIEAIKATAPRVQWIVRTHPTRRLMAADLMERLQALGISHLVTVDAAVDTPLATLLMDCDLHVTQYSSVVIEAASMGVPTAVLHNSALDLYPEQVANGLAILARSAADLISEVETTRKRAQFENSLPPLAERLRRVMG